MICACPPGVPGRPISKQRCGRGYYVIKLWDVGPELSQFRVSGLVVVVVVVVVVGESVIVEVEVEVAEEERVGVRVGVGVGGGEGAGGWV